MIDTLKENYSAEQKILNAAREVFAEKGYDGASISEIAKRAGVNKALPFYYFQSKENLFKEVIRLGARETMERGEVYLRSPNPFAKETIEDYYEQILRSLESRKEIIRIVLAESLKSPGGSTLLFEFVDPVLKGVLTKLRSLGIDVKDPERLLTTELFFDTIPLFMFAVLGKEWTAYNRFDKEKVKGDFMGSFKSIYIDYVYNKYFRDKQ